MKYIEINRKFTEAVSNYMMQGYTINTNTMRNHGREIAAIDLTNGSEIIRVLLTTDLDDDFREFYELRIGKVKTADQIAPNSSKTSQVIFNNNLEVISSENMYLDN